MLHINNSCGLTHYTDGEVIHLISHQIKALANKPDDPSSIFSTYREEGKSSNIYIILCYGTHTHETKQ